MKKRLIYLILPLMTLILEFLPYGAVCNFANPEGESYRKTFSYFDLTPYGYANFTPFLTAVISYLILILITAYCVKGKTAVLRKARVLLFAAVIISLGPLTLGIEFFSAVGGLITLTLAAELISVHAAIKKYA